MGYALRSNFSPDSSGGPSARGLSIWGQFLTASGGEYDPDKRLSLDVFESYLEQLGKGRDPESLRNAMSAPMMRLLLELRGEWKSALAGISTLTTPTGGLLVERTTAAFRSRLAERREWERTLQHPLRASGLEGPLASGGGGVPGGVGGGLVTGRAAPPPSDGTDEWDDYEDEEEEEE